MAAGASSSSSESGAGQARKTLHGDKDARWQRWLAVKALQPE